MEGALAWIGQIVAWIGQFIPRWELLDPTMGGVKIVQSRGKVRVEVLKPGITWYWPATTLYKVTPVKRQGDDLRSQTLQTADDKTIVVGGMIITEITDVVQYLVETYDGPTTVAEITLTTIHDVICELNWDELKTEHRKGTLDTKLKNAAQKALAPYGVRVIKVMLTDLAPTRVYKLLQATTID